jgi:hypothetical protein
MMLGRRALLLGAANAAASAAVAQPFGDATLGPLTGRAPGGVAGNQGPRGPASLPPTLDLNFMTGPPLDPRLTFTRASTATYFNAAGTMQTAAVNTPRFDYDPVTHAALGLLIEEQRTNLLTQSTFGASWATVGSAALTPNAAAGLDGATSAASFLATDITNSIRAVAQSDTASATAAYTMTVYARSSATPTNLHMQINNQGPAAAAVAYFDLTNGVAVVGADLVAGFTAKSASITRASGTWWRAQFGFTTPAATTSLQVYLGPCQTVSASGDNRSYTGVVGQGVYLWGAQLELGAFPTSYIPTTAAAVTRAIDQCSMPIGSWFDQTKGSLTYEYILEGSPTSYGAPVAFVGANAVTDHIAPDRLDAAGSATAPTMNTAVVSVGGTSNGYAFYTPSIPLTAGLIHRGAIAWTTNAVVTAAHDGVLGASAGTTTTLPVITTLAIAGSVGGQPIISQWARRTRYWPRVLSNSELQSVTT